MMTDGVHGVVEHPNSDRRTDYLFRVSIKCLIYDHTGQVLVVREKERDHWDLPGGGMDHGENIKDAIARELSEEVSLAGDFSYRIITIEEPGYLDELKLWQIRFIVAITPNDLRFDAGEDGDEIAFIDPATLQNSTHPTERKVYTYAQLDNQVGSVIPNMK